MIEAMFVAMKINTTGQIHPFNSVREILASYAAPAIEVGVGLTVPRFALLIGLNHPEPIYWTADGASSCAFSIQLTTTSLFSVV